jgi:hypothetical protein
MTCGRSCEVRDFVLIGPTADVELRLLNEAANVELRRRGQPELTDVSGELIGDAIAWVPTPPGCTVGWVDEGTLPVVA